MQRIVLGILILGSLISPCRGDEQLKLPAKERFHLYLLIGQSNMAGRGVVEEQDKQTPPRDPPNSDGSGSPLTWFAARLTNVVEVS